MLSGRSFSKTVIGRAAFTNYGEYLPWNTTSVPNGTYSLQSVITDERGRTSDSPGVSIKVDNSDN